MRMSSEEIWRRWDKFTLVAYPILIAFFTGWFLLKAFYPEYFKTVPTYFSGLFDGLFWSAFLHHTVLKYVDYYKLPRHLRSHEK